MVTRNESIGSLLSRHTLETVPKLISVCDCVVARIEYN
jgi:hypothetical protein